MLVTEKEVEAYLGGGVEGLGDLAGSTTATAPDGAASTLGKGQVTMVVAIGAEARAAVVTANPNRPVISTMLTLADISGGPAPLAKPAGAVYLDVDFGQVPRNRAFRQPYDPFVAGRIAPEPTAGSRILAELRHGRRRTAKLAEGAAPRNARRFTELRLDWRPEPSRYSRRRHPEQSSPVCADRSGCRSSVRG